MNQISPSCNRFGVPQKCFHCQGASLVKSGTASNGKQRFLCKNCRRRFLESYSYRAYLKTTDTDIVQFLKEGVGIRSTARLLKISPTTVLSRLLQIAKYIKLPFIFKGRTYEVDEIQTFVKRKEKLIWIVYALERSNRQVVSFNIGARTNKTLSVVLKTLSLSEAKVIYTDKLVNYRFLIDRDVHKTDLYGTNHIERRNLTIRTHLKRLNRRTICYSRSVEVLRACLIIYFFS